MNYEGTLNVIDACRALGIKKIVMSSSPSTRFDGNNINGARESELSIRPPGKFLQVSTARAHPGRAAAAARTAAGAPPQQPNREGGRATVRHTDEARLGAISSTADLHHSA